MHSLGFFCELSFIFRQVVLCDFGQRMFTFVRGPARGLDVICVGMHWESGLVTARYRAAAVRSVQDVFPTPVAGHFPAL